MKGYYLKTLLFGSEFPRSPLADVERIVYGTSLEQVLRKFNIIVQDHVAQLEVTVVRVEAFEAVTVYSRLLTVDGEIDFDWPALRQRVDQQMPYASEGTADDSVAVLTIPADASDLSYPFAKYESAQQKDAPMAGLESAGPQPITAKGEFIFTAVPVDTSLLRPSGQVVLLECGGPEQAADLFARHHGITNRVYVEWSCEIVDGGT